MIDDEGIEQFRADLETHGELKVLFEETKFKDFNEDEIESWCHETNMSDDQAKNIWDTFS